VVGINFTGKCIKIIVGMISIVQSANICSLHTERMVLVLSYEEHI